MKKGEKQALTFQDRLTKFGAAAKAAFIAAAAAAAAYAGKLAIDGVKAAIADEQAQTRLANALKNVTNATNAQVAAVEAQINKMSLAYGIADDDLRPAFQRLAVATGDLSEANKGLQLALDISASTGKSLESVSNALGKAYEGNTASLARLGVGLSSVEIKALGLDGTIKQLSQTFGGAASQQAETFQGRLNRVKVAFDETVETVGYALLPIIERLLNFIVNTAIPKFKEFKEEAIDPVIQAIKNNEAALRSLYEFGKAVLEPFLKVTLFNAIEGIKNVASGIVSAVSAALRALEPLINAAIAGINAVIRAKNLLLGGNTPTISSVDFSGLTSGVSLGNRPLGGAGGGLGFTGGSSGGGGTVSGGGGKTSSGGGAGGAGAASSQASRFAGIPIIDALTELDNALKQTNRQLASGSISPYVAQQRLNEFINMRDTLIGQVESGYRVNINVNSPSIIDETGFTRAVVNALNSVERRQGGGASALVGL